MHLHQPKRRTTILAIDDDPTILAELGETLGGTGFTFDGCTDTTTGAELARSLKPDLIISDINLGCESGLEMIARLKSEAGLSDVPVIFLSGAPIPDIVKRSHAAGGTYYVRKPFDPDVLVELVDKALWMPHLVTNQMR